MKIIPCNDIVIVSSTMIEEEQQILIIDHTKVQGTSHIDFPVLVDLSDLDKDYYNIFDTCTSDGGDIRVWLNDGITQLAREIVEIDTVNRTGSMWIKIPALSGTSNTVLIITANGVDTEPAPDSTYGSENVWNSSYKGVYHMNQDPSGIAPQILDSTSNNNHGTSSGNMTSDDLVEGNLSCTKAVDFDGVDDTIILNNSLSFGTSDISISCWINLEEQEEVRSIIFGSHPYNPPNGRCYVENHIDKVRMVVGDDSDYVGISSSISVLDRWVLIHGVRSNDTVSLYINGSLNSSDSDDIFDVTNSSLWGWSQAYSSWGYLRGKVGNTTVLSTTLDSDWIATEYNNQKPNSTFYSVPRGFSSEIGYMFDDYLNTQSENEDFIDVTIEFNNSDRIALFNIDAYTIQLDLTDMDTSTLVQSKTIDLELSNGEYKQWIIESMYIYPNAQLRIQIIKTGSTAKCGKCGIGLSTDIGATQYTPSIGFNDYSIKTENLYGTYLAQGNWSKLPKITTMIDYSSIDAIAEDLVDIRGTFVFFEGNEDDTEYEGLMVYGFLEDWSIDISNPTIAYLDLNIQGAI